MLNQSTEGKGSMNRYFNYYSRPLSYWIVSDTKGDYRGAPYKLVSYYQTQEAAEYVTSMLNSVERAS